MRAAGAVGVVWVAAAAAAAAAYKLPWETPLSTVTGPIDGCCCDADRVSAENERHLFPTLEELSEQVFFQYFKIDLDSECPLWVEEHICTTGGCGVCECDENEIPLPWREETTAEADMTVDHSLFKPWTAKEADVWIAQDDKKMRYISLERNKEKYTGYGGASAGMVWNAIYSAIYQECSARESPDEPCLEERVLYRLVSGFHSSVTMSIVLTSREDGEPNLPMFQYTIGAHADRAENMFFTYLFLLRAVNRASEYLAAQSFDTGNPENDRETKRLVQELLADELVCSQTFDETQLFQDIDLKSTMKTRFRNISGILDCVSCESCRLFSKLQIMGIGAALKILFDEDAAMMHLERNELIALIATLHKFSHSIHNYHVLAAQFEAAAEVQFLTTAATAFAGLAALLSLACCMAGRGRGPSAAAEKRETSPAQKDAAKPTSPAGGPVLRSRRKKASTS